MDVDRGLLVEPVVCVNCDSRSSFEMIHNRGMFNDKQMIKIQEAPESIPQGETPSTVTVIAYESLVDSVKPGDRVDITGKEPFPRLSESKSGLSRLSFVMYLF